ncbi:hypothetical protein YA62_024830 [Agrobacterium sp. LC34]|uniref:Uncharacterized protein n=1 Tax=Rhizobium subbaraonis TaxID=908946 RepID=A0A285UUZ0_9HYPH|nr:MULTISPECIES: hypothetical protein [Rhizobium/Agrobacterium group]KNY31229.1 hypothetical protein AKG12_25340 [Agrobacterium sp. SUL3]TKT56076.1 hypothetical protein YA62_024830 [Agrobacterium sp. LC34]SOC45603.1 hypothetical protein SAMN05892877_116130 [Rhizobium subbaraonis]
MSASLVFKLVPIGSVVSWSDGTPRPPERHKKKLAAWKTRNSSGRLIRKQPTQTRGSYTAPDCFTIHEGDHGSNGTIVLRVYRTFDVGACSLSFSVVERPAIGSVRIFDRAGEGAELVHVAANRSAAEEWLTRHRHPHAVLEDVERTQESPSAEQAAA